MVRFLLNSVLLGVGLAMDAFSVSLAGGLADPHMSAKRSAAIAGTFGAFQFLMPMAGWFLVHTAVELFSVLDRFVPWIAMALLAIIGGKMLYEGVRGGEEETARLSAAGLFVAGIATSIDALSVGFTTADYQAGAAFAESLIIGTVTFAICLMGLKIGARVGSRLAGKAQILGGAVLIGIGLEILLF